jgi:hypothetical protein
VSALIFIYININKKMSDNKIQPSTLNNTVIPDDKFVEEIENYTPKLSEDIVKMIIEEKGFNSTDPRV